MAEPPQDKGHIVPENIDTFLEGIPEEKAPIVRELMAASLQFEMSQIVNPDVAMLQKVTSEHVDRMIENEGKLADYHYRDRREGRRFTLLLVFVAMFFVVAVIFLLQNNENLLERVVTLIVGLVSGAIGGFGVGRMKRNSD